MIATTKIKYAMNALVFLAMNKGNVISAKEISERLNIPKEFISKILQSLVGAGIVKSRKGKNGGFVFDHDPEDLFVNQIFNALDYNAAKNECWLGLAGKCQDSICGLCEEWERMFSKFEKTIRDISLQTLTETQFSTY